MSDQIFEGQTAIVTGASTGIGRATAEIMASRGAKVVAVDIAEEALGWASGNANIATYIGDVSTEKTNDDMVALAKSKFGRLDIAVFNAGIAGNGPLERATMDRYDEIMAINLRGVVLGMTASIPAMREVGGGAMVVTASVSGIRADPGMWAYNASKGGVINLARAAAIDLALDNIRVNVMCPGPVRTGITKPIEDGLPEVFEGLRSHIPLQRWGEPEECGEVIAFLASKRASFVNGAVVPVDGGVTANTSQFLPPQLQG
jgi:NAD(P)-dependent dehydrogenase (short-subunit alcohol dehydrogenase family)